MLDAWLGTGSVWTSPSAFWFWPVYILTFYLSNTGMVGRARRTAGEGRVAGETAAALGAMLLASHALALGLSWWGLTAFPQNWQSGTLAIGLIVMLAAMALRLHCYRVLGRHFTPDVRVYDDHQIVETGAYRFVRHPGYSASLLMLVGLGLAAGTWLGLAVLVGVGLYVFHRRIRFEERVLLERLGEPYATFCATRKRLIPGLY